MVRGPIFNFSSLLFDNEALTSKYANFKITIVVLRLPRVLSHPGKQTQNTQNDRLTDHNRQIDRETDRLL